MARETLPWSGEASDPRELADELEAAQAQVFRPFDDSGIVIVTFTCSAANRDMMVEALRAYGAARKR